MPKCFVPHTFRAGDAIDPRQVNENALAIHSHFLRMMDDRYNYFSVVLPFGLLTASEHAATPREFDVPIRIPFAAEIVSAEMSLYSTNDGSGADTDVSVTCDLDNWNTLTATLDESDTTTRQSDFSAQSVTIPADTVVTFTASSPGANNEMLLYVVLHCRYDCIAGYEAEESVTIAAPTLPQVTDDESYDTAEWSAWHTAMDTQIDRLSAALKRRKRFEIYTMGKDMANGIANTSARGHFWLPGRVTDYVEEVRAFILAAATEDIAVQLYKGGSTLVGDAEVQGAGVGTWANGVTSAPNPDVSGSLFSAEDLELRFNTNGSATILRHHAIISWREYA